MPKGLDHRFGSQDLLLALVALAVKDVPARSRGTSQHLHGGYNDAGAEGNAGPFHIEINPIRQQRCQKREGTDINKNESDIWHNPEDRKNRKHGQGTDAIENQYAPVNEMPIQSDPGTIRKCLRDAVQHHGNRDR